MTSRVYFNAERDSALIAAGTHFWCQICLVARPVDDQSMDLRYCLSCFSFLKAEAEILPSDSRCKWVPESPQTTQGAKRAITVPQDGTQIMHTLKDKKYDCFVRSGIMHTKDLIVKQAKENECKGGVSGSSGPQKSDNPVDTKKELPKLAHVSHGKRGPKFKALPIELITQWAGEGMGSKAIVTRLKSEKGIKVHYSTIQRIITGQRVLV